MTVTGDSSPFVSFPTIFALRHFICTSTKYFICDCRTGPKSILSLIRPFSVAVALQAYGRRTMRLEGVNLLFNQHQPRLGRALRPSKNFLLESAITLSSPTFSCSESPKNPLLL